VEDAAAPNATLAATKSNSRRTTEEEAIVPVNVMKIAKTCGRLWAQRDILDTNFF
jgi:hypothetical protein